MCVFDVEGICFAYQCESDQNCNSRKKNNEPNYYHQSPEVEKVD